MNGFSFVEVLVALLLLSVGMLHFMQQQTKLKSSLQHTYFKSVALQQALSLLDRWEANSNKTDQLVEWNDENKELLPGGRGECRFDGNRVSISICWKLRSDQCLKITPPF
jgi:prepilin-type N-terminal cleavage/methylation domain-containing protein